MQHRLITEFSKWLANNKFYIVWKNVGYVYENHSSLIKFTTSRFSWYYPLTVKVWGARKKIYCDLIYPHSALLVSRYDGISDVNYVYHVLCDVIYKENFIFEFVQYSIVQVQHSLCRYAISGYNFKKCKPPKIFLYDKSLIWCSYWCVIKHLY